MSYRSLAVVCTLVAVAVFWPSWVVAQTTDEAPPRTSWGAPDLQGVWDFRSITPMQRPEELAGKEFLTEEEAAALERETLERNEELANRAASIRSERPP